MLYEKIKIAQLSSEILKVFLDFGKSTEVFDAILKILLKTESVELSLLKRNHDVEVYRSDG